MLMPLAEAQVINPGLTLGALEALESTIRAESNNHFHKGVPLRIGRIEGATVYFTSSHNSFKAGDTVELHGTAYYDGFYHVETVRDDHIVLTERLVDGWQPKEEANIYRVYYPPDVVEGAKKVLDYSVKMSGKMGIKSETVSRVSVSYYDVDTQAGLIFGVPSYLFAFLDPYRKRRFG